MPFFMYFNGFLVAWIIIVRVKFNPFGEKVEKKLVVKNFLYIFAT